MPIATPLRAGLVGPLMRVSLTSSAPTVRAGLYTAISLGTLPGTTFRNVTDLNDQGQVARHADMMNNYL